MIIKLNQYKGQPYNIGGIIGLNYKQSYEDEKKSFLLQISNDVMYGHYFIPNAIGFSTPLHILGDLKTASIKIIPVNDYGCNDSLLAYNAWKHNYQSKLYNIKPKIFPYSTDKENCSICLEKYKVGENICKLQLCGHYFHKKCIDQLSRRTTCPLCRNHAFKHSMNDLSFDDQIDLTLSEMGL
jgi:hypothetical protein